MKLIAREIKKDFPRASKSSNYFTAVQPLDFELESGKMIEITGRSGSGKSTLLNILAGMLTPTYGKVLLDDTDIYALDEKSLSRLRNEKIGLIPQGHTALLSLTVLENVILPAILYHKDAPPEDRAKELLEQVGISNLANAKPNELSGGELRRMAIARAMLRDAPVILLDEATSALDVATERQVLRNIIQRHPNKTCIVTTHRPTVLNMCQRVYRVVDTRVTELSEEESSRLAMDF